MPNAALACIRAEAAIYKFTATLDEATGTRQLQAVLHFQLPVNHSATNWPNAQMAALSPCKAGSARTCTRYLCIHSHTLISLTGLSIFP